MSYQWSGSSRNCGISVVPAPCPLGLGFCDVQLLHPGKPGGQKGLYLQLVESPKQALVHGQWLSLCCSLSCATYSVLTYIDPVIQEFAFDVSYVFCLGFLIRPTLLHGQWVFCLFQERLMSWSSRHMMPLVYYFSFVRSGFAMDPDYL